MFWLIKIDFVAENDFNLESHGQFHVTLGADA